MTDDSNHASSHADSARERELYRYYQPSSQKKARKDSLTVLPDNDPVSADEKTSPDKTLTALAQLTAIRLNAPRAMVSVIDKQHQYFLAESSKSLDIADSKRCEVKGDALWIGCSRVQKEGRLCEETLKLKPVPGGFPCFVVTDLSEDTRYNQQPLVTSPPFVKYYAGVPLTTENGINIGTLFILDIVRRPVLKLQEKAFLGSIAQIIMRHMEVFREAEERKRIIRMSRGLNAFVEGKSVLGPLRRSSLNLSKSPESGQVKSWDYLARVARSKKALVIISDELDDTLPTADATQDGKNLPTDQESSQSGSEDEDPIGKEDTGHERTVKRAANLLLQSLDFQHGGGVVYLDTTMDYHRQGNSPRPNPEKSEAPDYFENATCSLSASRQENPSVSTPGISMYEGGNGSLDERRPQNPAGIISFSNSDDCKYRANETSGVTSFTPLGEETLQYFLDRYPQGKLWSFDEDGSLLASEEEKTQDERTTQEDGISRGQKNRLVARMLRKHFPAVRQLLFAPLWDSGAVRWFSGCFVFNNSNVQVFSREPELNFVTAFNNSVMAEVSRLISIAADRQKADFIGSISHELRSPLHGILASADFLAESKPDVFQASLVSTVSSCGRTLLDTITHILDFCKINSFERNWQNVRKHGMKSRKQTLKARPPLGKTYNTLTNLFAITDVAALTEEIIEGVFVGQVYQDIGSSGIADGVSGSPSYMEHRFNVGASSGRRFAVKDVEVILDIAREDFIFTTQPGAVKRIIMNIFGNAVKYTDNGTILVKLSLGDSDETDLDSTPRMLEITIEDTGKGISTEYLRTRLYTPFCQEDVLASGTGLGLSIVRSIVTTLDGTIEIWSQVRQGTKVKICIPMMRVPRADSISTSNSSTIETPHDDPIQELRMNYPGMIVTLYGLDQETETSRVLKYYLSEWFGFEIISTQPTSRRVDIIVVNEQTFSDLQETNYVASSVIVLCNTLRSHRKGSYASGNIAVEFMSKPFGPSKLARALRICLDKARELSTADLTLELRCTGGSGMDDPAAQIQGGVTQSGLEPAEIKQKQVSPPVGLVQDKHPPRLLLVDDNLINLRLLETYMRKRKQEVIDSAQNGLQAVQAAERNPHGYDIIFMDISMPVMNGFEATRAIRKIEHGRGIFHRSHDDDHPSASDNGPDPIAGNGALIVALTGLASERDQKEAFSSGVDMFLTKPISFKDVGALLNRWEASHS